MLVDIQTSAVKGRVFRLMQPIVVKWQDKPAVIVPWGFLSDGASVPRAFWRLVFPKGDEKALRAAFVHDFLYRRHPEGWTRAEADQLFYELLLKDGVPQWRAWLAYQGVRLFGGLAWKTRGEC